MTAKHADKVRLEVDASDVTNLISNHSGQGGATTGWTGETGVTLAAITNPTRSGETLLGSYTGGKTIRANYGAAASASSRVLGPSFSVDAGEQIGFSYSLADSQDDVLWVRAGVVFYDSGAAEISPGSTAYWTNARQLLNDDAPWRMVEFFGRAVAAPANANSARVFWQFGAASVISPRIQRDVYLSKVMVVSSMGADASPAVTDVPFSDTATVWQNVLGSATSAQIRRGGRVSGVVDEIDPGMLTATVTDPVVDPAQNPRMRRGRMVRFMALDDAAVWRPIFTGRVESLDVVYEDKFDPSAQPRVTITAVDAIAELAKTGRPFNYAGGYGPKVKALMAVSSVPYVADAGSASTTIVHRDQDRGKLWDQLELARNTFSGGRLWVDASGTLHAVTVTPSGVADHEFHDRTARAFTNLVTNPSFEGSTSGLTVTSVATVSAALSTAWAERGTRSALVSKSSATNAEITVNVAPTAGIPVVSGEYFSVRVAVKAVIAFSSFRLVAQEWNGATPVGTTYTIVTSAAMAAGGVVVLEALHLQPTQPTATRVKVSLVSASTAATGDMFYVDGWCMIAEGVEAGLWDSVPYADNSGLWEPVGTPYVDVDVRYGADALANELIIVANNASESDGAKEYGPYKNAVSQADWGVAPARVEVVDPASPSTLAGTYLERFADPVIFPRSVKFRAQDADSEALFTDLYDECRVAHGPSGTDAVVPAIGIEHVITPLRWDVTLGFRPEESSTITVTNPAAGADTGPDDVAGAPTYVSSSSVLTALTNWTVNSQSFIRVGSLVMWTATITYSGTTRTVPANGDVANLDVASMDADWWPHLVQPFAVTTGGPLVGGYVHTSGVLAIGPVAPGTSFASGAAWSIGGVYAIKKG